ncbi:hypothetical protein ZIOFF_002929 [Zingiber officinale]|uniref:Photosystem I reaction center subunit VI n=1 Tax=Zingiber officinale TaxID=94328 RepID=A0A8J5IMH8_ZINOF|nr:hypothetical protein ZIOFF_002929 [Zingiber officinale]
MASLTAVAAVQPATVKGLAGSSFGGKRLAVKPSRLAPSRANLRSGAVVAKYGENSVYFDLDDIGNTTGQWDVYGTDASSPYNSLQVGPKRAGYCPYCLLVSSSINAGEVSDKLQSKFFETFAAPFTKRGLLLKFLLLGGAFTIAYLGSTASGDLLPIKKGPQLPPTIGPRDKI